MFLACCLRQVLRRVVAPVMRHVSRITWVLAPRHVMRLHIADLVEHLCRVLLLVLLLDLQAERVEAFSRQLDLVHCGLVCLGKLESAASFVLLLLSRLDQLRQDLLACCHGPAMFASL